ncbi:TIGR00730 family Rossman fold protein [Candidatus Saccharibacteria bacterium]|nr:TIGR00730 family Rossman fold protein [Candidatus Saccharibacteria bacterium]
MVSKETNVCVFCGASNGKNPAYVKAATELGERLAQEGFGLVYGAGGSGMMGAVSDGALSKGGYVTGIIPQSMMDREWGREDISDLQIVGTIQERKVRMYDLSSFLVTLPGGFGTLEEFFESLTWSQLKYHTKPAFVLNVEGYYDDLKALLNRARDDEFVRAGDRELVTVVDTVDELLKHLKVRQLT